MTPHEVLALHKEMLDARQRAFMSVLQACESSKECRQNPDDALALAELTHRKATAHGLMERFQTAVDRYIQAKNGSSTAMR